MTLQQMEHIVAVDKYRHFVKAAESCGISQAALSLSIQKLESELEVMIFDRYFHPMRITPLGRQIIDQARVVLYNTYQIGELIAAEKDRAIGDIRMGIASTIAPYILPKFIRYISENHQGIRLHVEELPVCELRRKLESAELDLALMATPVGSDILQEIPVYKESFRAYVSADDPLYAEDVISLESLSPEKIWVIRDGYCPEKGLSSFCSASAVSTSVYEAGNVDILLRIVDENGGYAIIPEMHCPLLSKSRKLNVRKFKEPVPHREVSFIIRNDFVNQRLINIFADALKTIIPQSMLDHRLRKFKIVL